MKLSCKKVLILGVLVVFSQAQLEVFAESLIKSSLDSVLERHGKAEDHLTLYKEAFVRGEAGAKRCATIFIVGPGRRALERCFCKIGKVVVFENEWALHLKNWVRFGQDLFEGMLGKDKVQDEFDALRVVYFGIESCRSGMARVISEILQEVRDRRKAMDSHDFFMVLGQGRFAKVASHVAKSCPTTEPIDVVVGIAPPKKWSYRWFRFWKKKRKGVYRYKFVINVDRAQMPKEGPGEAPKRAGGDRRGFGKKIIGRIRDARAGTIVEYFERFKKVFNVKVS